MAEQEYRLTTRALGDQLGGERGSQGKQLEQKILRSKAAAPFDFGEAVRCGLAPADTQPQARSACSTAPSQAEDDAETSLDPGELGTVYVS